MDVFLLLVFTKTVAHNIYWRKNWAQHRTVYMDVLCGNRSLFNYSIVSHDYCATIEFSFGDRAEDEVYYLYTYTSSNRHRFFLITSVGFSFKNSTVFQSNSLATQYSLRNWQL